MKTYQDFEKARQERHVADFVLQAITDYATTDEYQTAKIGRDYMRQQNTTVMQLRRWLVNVFGEKVPDMYSPNYRTASSFYKSNIIQISQHLLSNGVTFEADSTKDKLGGDLFDNRLVRVVRAALSEGRAYGLYDGSTVTVLYADDFVPLLDEETGAIRAGIRHWQLAVDKPLRVILYEVDGYTEMRREQGGDLVCVEGFSFDAPKPYKRIVAYTQAGGAEIVGYENFPGLPIVPCYGNYDRTAEIVGKRENIDCYDLIKSGMANNIEEASFLYWEMSNASGMSDLDMAKFRERLSQLHVAKTDGQTQLTAHALNVPTEARETLLQRLENDIYTDAMTVNMDKIAGGEVRATAIKAAYKRLNDRVDELEYCVIDFIQGLLKLAGVEDMPTFARSPVVNEDEITQMVLSAAEYLDEETVLKKLPFLSADEVQIILDRKAAEMMNMLQTQEGEETEVE